MEDLEREFFKTCQDNGISNDCCEFITKYGDIIGLLYREFNGMNRDGLKDIWGKFIGMTKEMEINGKYGELMIHYSDLKIGNVGGNDYDVSFMPDKCQEYLKLNSNQNAIMNRDNIKPKMEDLIKVLLNCVVKICVPDKLVEQMDEKMDAKMENNDDMDIKMTEENEVTLISNSDMINITYFLNNIFGIDSANGFQNRLFMFNQDNIMNYNILSEFMQDLFQVFITYYMKEPQIWVDIWKMCLMKLKELQPIYLRKRDNDFEMVFEHFLEHYFNILCCLNTIFSDNGEIKSLIEDVISFGLFHMDHVTKFDNTLLSTLWYSKYSNYVSLPTKQQKWKPDKHMTKKRRLNAPNSWIFDETFSIDMDTKMTDADILNQKISEINYRPNFTKLLFTHIQNCIIKDNIAIKVSNNDMDLYTKISLLSIHDNILNNSIPKQYCIFNDSFCAIVTSGS